jgi:hypothetical protein
MVVFRLLTRFNIRPPVLIGFGPDNHNNVTLGNDIGSGKEMQPQFHAVGDHQFFHKSSTPGAEFKIIRGCQGLGLYFP